MTPLETMGYQCIAKGSVSKLPTLTDEQLWELNKGFDRPSISIRQAEVIDQSLLDIHLVHGSGVGSLVGSMQLLVRIVQIKPVLPTLQYNPPSISNMAKKSPPLSPTPTSPDIPEPYMLMEGLNRHHEPVEAGRASIQSLKGKVTRMSGDKALPSYIETDPETGFEHEKRIRSSLRSSLNTSLGVSLDIHGGIRWRNPNDIEWKPSIPQNIQYRTYDNSKGEHNFKPFANRQTIEHKSNDKNNPSLPSSKKGVGNKRHTLIDRHKQAVRTKSTGEKDANRLHKKKGVDYAFMRAMQDVKITTAPHVDLLLPSEEADQLGIKFTPHQEEAAVQVLDTSFDSVMEIHNEQLHEYVPEKDKSKLRNKQQKNTRSNSSGSNNRISSDKSGSKIMQGRKSGSSTTPATTKQDRQDVEILIQNLSPAPPPLLVYSNPSSEKRTK